MGTRTSHFVIYGLMLPYIKGSEQAGDDDEFELEDAWLDRIEPYDARTEGSGVNRVVVLSDGMGGRYTAVGFCVAHAGETEGFAHVELPRSEMSDPTSITKMVEWRHQIEDVLKKLDLLEGVRSAIGRGEQRDLAWHVFTHYR